MGAGDVGNIASANGQKTAARSVSVVLASDHPPLSAVIDESTLATSANQTSGAQKSQRVDGAGNVTPAGDTAARAVFMQPGPAAVAPAVQNLALGSTSAAAFASAAATRGVWIQALSTNTASVFIGPAGVTTGTGLELQAGDREFFPCDNANRFSAITGTATQNLRALVI